MTLFATMAHITTLTAREAEICSFVLANPEETSRMSARELAHATYSSAATVSRFCRKVGCDGYTDFRMQLAGELGAGAAGVVPVGGRLTPDQTLNDIHIVMRVGAHFALAEADASLDARKLERMLDILRTSTDADIYSADDAFGLTAYACRLLQHAGKNVVAYGPGEAQLDHALHSPARRPAIFVTRTGETKQLVSTARILAEKDSSILAVVGNPDSTLAGLAQEVVAVPYALDDDPLAFCQFTTGAKYVLDVLYAALYTDSFDDNESLSRACLMETKRLWMLPQGERMQR